MKLRVLFRRTKRLLGFNVFKRINILLSDPICDCEEQKLGWGTTSSHGISIDCKTCGTTLTVPHSKFVARFVLDRPYPSDAKKREAEDGSRGGKEEEGAPDSEQLRDEDFVER